MSPECTHISNKVHDFMSIFGLVFDKLFVQKNHKINAAIVIQQLKEKKIDIKKLETFMGTLPKDQWNLQIFLDNIATINEIFGISDEEIKAHCVSDVTEKDIKNVRWEVVVESMLEYSKFSTEYYDALKYNKSSGLSVHRIKLLNELMMTFKLIKEDSKKLYDRYHNRKFSDRAFQRFNMERIHLEFLMFRILYIALNIRDCEEKKLEHFAKLLGTERISIAYHKKFLPRFN